MPRCCMYVKSEFVIYILKLKGEPKPDGSFVSRVPEPTAAIKNLERLGWRGLELNHIILHS